MDTWRTSQRLPLLVILLTGFLCAQVAPSAPYVLASIAALAAVVVLATRVHASATAPTADAAAAGMVELA